jgi:hypothetical protein
MDIKYKDWKTGEEKEYRSSDSITLAGLICPFDGNEIIDRNYYHNEHDTFCPSCRMDYSRHSSQAEIDQEAKENLIRLVKEKEKLIEREKALEERINHARSVGLLPPK